MTLLSLGFALENKFHVAILPRFISGHDPADFAKAVPMNKPLRTAPLASNVDRCEPATPGFEVLEPRIMLDANLEWDMGAVAGGFDFGNAQAMLEMLATFEAEFDATIDALQGDMLAELGDAAPLFALEADAPDIGLGRLSDMVDRVEVAVDTVVTDIAAEYDKLLASFLGSGGSAPTSITNDINAALLSLSSTLTTNTTASTLGMNADFFLAIFSSEAAQDGTLSIRTELEDFFQGIDARNVYNDATAPSDFTATDLEFLVDETIAAFTDEFDAQDVANRQLMFSADLQDVYVGSDLVLEYVQGGTVGEVTVNVQLPDVDTFLDQLGHHPDLRTALPVVFDFLNNGAGMLSFDLTATAPGAGGASLTADDFATDHIFDLGGNSTTYATPPEIMTGFLSGELNAIEYAQLKLGLDWSGDITSTAERADMDLTNNVAKTLAGAFDFEILEVQDLAVGAPIVAWVDVDPLQSYLLTQFRIDSEIGLGSATSSLFAVGTTLEVSGALGALGQANTVAGRFDAATAGIDFAPGAGIVDPALQLAVVKMADTLFNMSNQTFSYFFAALGNGVASLISNNNISVAVPFTDIDIMDGFNAIADQIAALGDSFLVQPADLGFETTYGFAVEIENDVQTGITLDAAAIAKLANLGALTIDVFAPQAPGTSIADLTGPSPESVTIEFLSLNPFEADGSISSSFLSDFATQLTNGLALTGMSIGWTVSVVGGALQFTANSSNTQQFRVTGSTDRDTGNTPTIPVEFSSFGLTDRMLRQFDGVTTTGVTTVVSDSYDVIDVSFDRKEISLGALDMDVLIGMETLRFAITVDGVYRLVDIAQPTTGWGTPAQIAAQIQLAFDQRDIGMDVTANAAGTGLRFAHDGDDGRAYVVALDDSSLARVQSMKGLLAWTNDQLSSILPGVTLDLYVEDNAAENAVAGDIRLTMDPIEKTLGDLSTSGDPEEGTFGLNDIGLGDLEGVEVSAVLDYEIDAKLQLAAQINIFDLQEQFIAGGEDINSIPELVLQNAEIITLSLDADFVGEAKSLTGGADLGLIEFGLGLNDPTKNFAVFDSSLDVSVVGEENAVFGNTVRFAQLINIFGEQIEVGKDTAGDPILQTINAGAALANLIGRFNLTGNLIIDDKGCAVTSTNVKATTIADIDRFVEGTALVPGTILDAGEDRAMFYLNLGDMAADLGGIDGPALSAPTVGISIGNIFDPFGTTKFCSDLGDLECLVPLTVGGILDGLAGLSDLIDAYATQLAEQLTFLSVDIPLLNASLLDGLDFTTDFFQGIAELRAHPDFNLGTIEQLLQDVFGGDVSITFDNCVLKFDMELDFLTDFEETFGFNLKLSDLMSEQQLVDSAGADLAEILSSLVDARGDAELVFDPDIFLDLKFGLDLSQIKPDLTVEAVGATELDHVINAYTLILNTPDEPDAPADPTAVPPPTPTPLPDLRITWEDTTITGAGGSATGTVNIDLDGSETLQDVIDKINAELSTLGSGTVSSSLVDGQIVIGDSNTTLINSTDVERLFGAATVESNTTVEPLGEIILDTAFTGAAFTSFSAAYSFDIKINDGDPAKLELAADPARTTKEAFAAALNVAMLDIAIARTDITDTGIPLTQVALFQLLRASVTAGGEIVITGTNFADVNNFDPVTFAVQGIDESHDVTFVLQSIGTSNVVEALGFTGIETLENEARSSTLYDTPTIGRPIVFVDTGTTGTKLRGEVTIGAPDGLNMVVALGPVEAGIAGGQAFIGSQSGDAGFIEATIVDVDGTDDGRLDLLALIDIAEDPMRSFLDLFALDVELYTNINLPFSGAFGLLDPTQHGFIYKAPLLETATGAPIDFSDLATLFGGLEFDITDEEDVRALFQGDAIELLYEGLFPDDPNLQNLYDFFNPPFDRDIQLNLPSFGSLFDCTDVFELLNNPDAVLNGLDMIFSTIQDAVDSYLTDIDLPIIGTNLNLATNFFRDLRFDLIDPARDWVAEGNADGSKRTTADLVEDLLNAELVAMLNSVGGNVIAADAKLITLESSPTEGPDKPDEPFIYGAISFDLAVFSEALDIGFDLDIPGLELGVDDATAITLTGNLKVNLGFGLDCNGFFLLNDTDTPELAFELVADAGAFKGKLNLYEVLGVNATTAPGDAKVTVTFGIDLFGDGGTDLGRDYTDLVLPTGADFENTLYLTEVDFNEFATFVFKADIHLDLAMEIQVLDPAKGDGSPLTIDIGGETRTIFPIITTNFQFDATFDPLTHGLDLFITNMKFFEVSIDVQSLYTGLLAPIFDPVLEMLDPLTSALDFINQEPFNYVTDTLSQFLPIFGMVTSIADIKAKFTGGPICIGTYDFLGYAPGGVLISDFTLDNARFSLCTPLTFPTIPGLDAAGPGIIVEIPILTDPLQALKLLTGQFSSVDLVTVEFLLLDLDFEIDFANDIINQIGGLPGWARGAITNALDAYIILDLYAGFKVGYDMSGIVNFMNTFDVVRLLDGAYIDARPGSLVDINVGGGISLNAGIAGASAALSAKAQFNFNDPNDDGRLRLAELVAMVEFVADNSGLSAEEIMGVFFEGFIDVSARLDIWAGINLPWPLPDLTFSVNVFTLPPIFNYTLSPTSIGPVWITELDALSEILNVGSNAAASLSKLEDGNDKITIDGKILKLGNTVLDTLGTNGVIIPAGNGTNIVDMTTMAGGMNSITYTGNGNDTIKLASTGTHVVFAGAGTDTITGGGTGTYIIFAEDGADTVNVVGENVIVIAGDDFGMRDLFLQKFVDGGLTAEAIRTTLGFTASGALTVANTATPGADSNTYNLNGTAVTLQTLLANYTAETQLNGHSDDEVITVQGAGNHLILTGSGDDLIDARSGADIKIYAGAGNDQIEAIGTAAYVEGGAGSDLIVMGNGTNVAWGWGAQGELEANTHLVRSDGDDIMVGGTGNDVMHGQYGRDVISGALGNDTLTGGHDNDLVSGGELTIFKGEQTPTGVVPVGAVIDLTQAAALQLLQTRLLVETKIGVADGEDSIDGGAGSDVLFGGAGNDLMTGGASADILVGDYGKISISKNRLAETFTSTGMDAAGAGTDNMNGGQGNDILVAGGSDNATAPEIVTDEIGNNIIFGDFGITEGTRILERVDAYRTIDSIFGTRDIITTGVGNDVIFGGEYDDTINSGLGGDIVFGDNGSYVVAKGTLSTTFSALDGNDVINAGSGAATDKLDIVLGGTGNDLITGTNGGLLAMADYGEMKLDATGVLALQTLTPLPAGASQAQIDADAAQRALIASLFENMSSIADVRSGNDTVTLGEGLSYVVLGGGADQATMGEGVSHIIGDDGSLISGFPLGSDGMPNGDPARVSAETKDGLNAGNDSITTAGGRDIILGGDGADTVNAGDGLNIGLTDNGRVVASITEDALPTSVESFEKAADGADVYIGGANDDIVILGGDSDNASLFDGLNYVLGDNGFIRAAPQTTGPDIVTVGTVNSANTGAETLTGGADRDVIIGGGGNDSLVTGEGVNAVLGDNGSVTSQHVGGGSLPLDVTAFEGSAEGNDTVVGGSIADLVGLGLGDDLAMLGTGDNRVLGDLGKITTTGTLGDDSVVSSDPTKGGADTITTGGGADVVVAGEGADSIIAGAGGDIVFGDAGQVQFNGAGGLHTAGAETVDHGGADIIDLGAGDDIAVGGLGDDSIMVGEGDDVALGDLIDLTFRNTSDLESLTLTRTDAGGEDTITADGTMGDNILVGQFGADTLTGGLNDDWIIGDLATVMLQSVTSKLPNQSAVDRIVLVEHGESDVAFDDLLSGGDGADFLLGGFGADTLFGGAGQDFLFGDTIILERTLNPTVPLSETIKLATNFAFVEGGLDQLEGGDGPDVMIGGLGPDLFFGNTADDVLIGDSFAAEFFLSLPTGFVGPKGERDLVQANFPGFGPNDILSAAQYNSAIGVYFSENGFFDGFADIGYTSFQFDRDTGPLSGNAITTATPIAAFLKQPEIIEHLASLLQFDTDPELIQDELLRAFAIHSSISEQDITPLQLEIFLLLLQRIQDQIESSVPQKEAA